MTGMRLGESFIVHNCTIFCNDEALMCLVGRDKIRNIDTIHTASFGSSLTGEAFQAVALRRTGKHLFVCQRVVQGEMPLNHC